MATNDDDGERKKTNSIVLHPLKNCPAGEHCTYNDTQTNKLPCCNIPTISHGAAGTSLFVSVISKMVIDFTLNMPKTASLQLHQCKEHPTLRSLPEYPSVILGIAFNYKEI
ncbi:unnamed protein product [Vicia faba]|uniref:Uncharacterized protein n=1 Tax=Vicia faba TaxID=3906 RepID=A0AAV0YRX6_VICFA|nr:unnamed protein product [Vicia faba]